MISTLAPREGSDGTWGGFYLWKSKFQPSLPARGATATAAAKRAGYSISTLAPREGSDHIPGHG